MKRVALILVVVAMVAGASLAAEGKGRKGHGKESPSVRGQITAVDVSLGMLRRTRAKLEGKGMDVPPLAQMDVQHLAFSDGAFDCAVATLVAARPTAAFSTACIAFIAPPVEPSIAWTISIGRRTGPAE